MSATARPAGPVLLGMTISRRPRRVALAGNPNVGKSSLYNALTGLRQKVTNYPGTTVEKVVGSMSAGGSTLDVVDLPGAYSLLPRSPDEAVARDEILGRIAGDPAPDVVVIVVDASNLDRNLFLATQILDTGRSCVIALNQADLALTRGIRVDAAALSHALGVPVVATCGRTGQGKEDLASAILAGGRRAAPLAVDLPAAVREEAASLAPLFAARHGGVQRAEREVAMNLLSEAAAQELAADRSSAADGSRAQGPTSDAPEQSAGAAEAFRAARERLAAAGIDVEAGAALARHEAVSRLTAATVTRGSELSPWQTRIDRVLLHPVAGSLVLVAVFAFLFLVVFSFSMPLVDLVDNGISALADWAGGLLGPGLFSDFVAKGVIAGFGSFLVFAPQIALLFVCIEALEDSGYLARAAYLLDRVMGKVGLPGRAFLPLLSGFACAIPGIMATRSIANLRDRLVTMAVLPLMSCTARLPVYGVVTGAVFSSFAFWVTPVVIIAMYLVGILVAVAAASVLRRTLLKGPRSPLLLELPPYRRPSLRTVGRNTGRRTWAFVAGAGPIILVLSMVLWGLMTFPQTEAPEGSDEATVAQIQRENSYMGRAGKAIEPALRPLGFDWKIGVGILASFAAREVFVPALGVMYAKGEEASEEDEGLLQSIREDTWPDGRPVYTPLVAISILVFYVLALQCMSTLAILKRETNSWRWPAGLFLGLFVIAYLASLVVYQVGTALGFR